MGAARVERTRAPIVADQRIAEADAALKRHEYHNAVEALAAAAEQLVRECLADACVAAAANLRRKTEAAGMYGMLTVQHGKDFVMQNLTRAQDYTQAIDCVQMMPSLPSAKGACTAIRRAGYGIAASTIDTLDVVSMLFRTAPATTEASWARRTSVACAFAEKILIRYSSIEFFAAAAWSMTCRVPAVCLP